ncbi:hypothetical protein ADEAN_001021000 [Angomonas deanei]|uniref:Uncharacterized protein n=1 Tax=Angomonas deanei TaxID=59799 RepID=A0A7G2CW55_9TRYP|nr:hypothetical protein ADEAN_001021000 [Angomonas deanei]
MRIIKFVDGDAPAESLQARSKIKKNQLTLDGAGEAGKSWTLTPADDTTVSNGSYWLVDENNKLIPVTGVLLARGQFNNPKRDLPTVDFYKDKLTKKEKDDDENNNNKDKNKSVHPLLQNVELRSYKYSNKDSVSYGALFKAAAEKPLNTTGGDEKIKQRNEKWKRTREEMAATVESGEALPDRAAKKAKK